MNPADRYVKIVEWSDEDGAFVGQCPGVIGPCCQGSDEIELAERDGTPLPPPTAGTGVAQRVA